MIGAARTLAVAGLVIASTWSLATLVLPDLWILPTACTLLVTSAVLVALRRVVRSVLGPTLVATVVAALFLHGWYTLDVAAVPGVPDGTTIAYLRMVIESAIAHTQVVLPPIADHPGVGLLVSAGATLAFLLTELVGVGSRAPAWSMVPVLPLWSIPVLLDARVSTGVLVVTGATFLAVLATAAAPERVRTAGRGNRGPAGTNRRRSPAWWPGVVVTTVACLVLALVAAPALLRIPNPVRIHSPAELGAASATRLELGLDLRDDLVRSQEETVITYTGAAPADLGPLHAYTLSDFDGSTWDRTAERTTSPVDADDEILWPTPTSSALSRTVEITVLDLRQDRLLLPDEPRSVQTADDTENLTYYPDTDELVVDRTRPGEPLRYEVTIHPRNLDPNRLRDLDPREQDSDPSWLAVPDTGYADEIAALARDIVADADAETGYDEALALQNYLRDPDEFTYTESVTAVRTTDAVWDFLDDRRGYCVQFATTMVMLARSLDLPARLAIGYLPGESVDGGGEIGSHSAHAWPQILFPEVGWVRFEPTPQQQTGTSPDWAPETPPTTEPTDSETASEDPSESPSTTDAPEETDEPTDDEGTASADSTANDRRELAAAGLVLLIGLATALTLILRRRERMGARGVEIAWTHVLHRLSRAGVPTRPDGTPRSYARAGTDLMSTSGSAALHALARAVEARRYRAAPTEPTRSQVTTWVREIERGLRRGPDGED
ncbi:transglutaminaseTgpA domain-containing protein [Ruania alba]|uniref:Transglutaminase-like enzyme, putative cysteine protease n=1 Tax=Ruania alba TaxID=648782 RepID=A0A1H5E8S1_9MICO|nr:DUF3488 and transglutaminase-like domain-containing protein [Ruania alba]SED87505.1 Transglutaminase-like enzyme, putative cysteine protease [Ruania alba]